MADDNKISIDIKITGDGQKIIDQYTHSFQSLRNAVNGLSPQFNTLSNNLSSLDKNLSNIASSTDNADNKLSDISTSFANWANIITLLTNTLKGWTAALTGGLAIVTILAPEIIKWVSALFKGSDALVAITQNFKNFNDVMRSSNKDVASESTRLKILYKSATDLNNATADRLLSVKELKKEFPSHFAGLKDETILNGNAKSSYDDLTKSIFENARARAAEIKIEQLAEFA